MTLNETKFNAIVETAKAKAAGDNRWTNAINKAVEQFQTNPYISYQDGGLLILGTTGNIYHSNGTCGCKAFKNGMPCWHRALAKLVQRYFEKEVA